MAPVAPHCPDIEENGFILGFGAGECGVAPFVPVDRLVRGGAEIRTGGMLQPVRRMISQGDSQFALAKEEAPG